MKKFLKACKAVVDYMWEDEVTDWEECGKPENHIFTHINIIHEFLEQVFEFVNDEES
jgi:hypothetical protein